MTKSPYPLIQAQVHHNPGLCLCTAEVTFIFSNVRKLLPRHFRYFNQPDLKSPLSNVHFHLRNCVNAFPDSDVVTEMRLDGRRRSGEPFHQLIALSMFHFRSLTKMSRNY